MNRGAFTDARRAKAGLFEVADGGTLFLDEIGDLAHELQPKLLHVLEETSFRRLGGTTEVHVDVRIVAATNRDLTEAVEAGRFRADLFYRLNVLGLALPALRERDETDRLDVIHRTLVQLDAGAGARLAPRTLDLLLAHPWPGNVRELRNVLERALVLAGEGGEILPVHLPTGLRQEEPGPAAAAPNRPLATLESVERDHIRRTLEALGGNRLRAAMALGISRGTLYAKIRKYGLG